MDDTIKESAFRRDIIALLKNERGGHTSCWTYNGRERPAHQPSGGVLWSAFLAANNNYYIPIQEADLIHAALPMLAKKFKHADTLVDLGSGNAYAVENKALPVFKACPNTKIYVPVDLAEGLLLEAKAVATKHNIDVQPIQADFYRDRLANSKEKIVLPGESRAGIMFGSTISNMNMTLEGKFPQRDISRKIKKLGQLLSRDSDGPTSLAISYDSNRDLEGSALKAYDNIHWKRMIVGLMIDIQTILKPEGNFNAFAWEHIAIPDKERNVIQQCVRATKNQAFSIGNEIFAVHKGDMFVVVNNFKYPTELMSSLIEKAGYTPDSPIKLPGENQHMIVQTMDVA